MNSADTTTQATEAGGFAGDPAAALAVAGTGGCCGNPPTALALPDSASDGAPCCGTPAEATAERSCCATAARTDAVAAGQGCCG
ncbi:hypothetical protein ACFFX1_52675 [Dactylosporangium sucinum]|uniref:Uncharacterized protein n=1 Tax=Dactylosporangium sucinum TaxID=1424081 RepID=A0A917UGW4_9ACTN|nr:hypothetical protein [Dactylosporangium sucinum]GGM89633.1 hypothetical protein GCM10007977_109580 [Dactylosporangium sucinum]